MKLIESIRVICLRDERGPFRSEVGGFALHMFVAMEDSVYKFVMLITRVIRNQKRIEI